MPQTPAQREYVRHQRQIRRALGVCLTCGKERGQGSTPTVCHACREKSRQACRRYNETHPDTRRESWRDYQQKRRDQSRAADLCHACGKTAPAPGLAVCALFNQHQRQRDLRHRDKKRHVHTPASTGDPKTYAYRLGLERPRLNGKVRILRVALDAWAYLNLMNLMRDQRERERTQGQYPRADGLSLLVRQCVLQHEHHPCPVHRQTDEMHEHRLGVSLDDRTVALLDAHAARHYPNPDGGPPNRSAALRDFLIAARPRPRWIAASGGPRHYPDIEEKLFLSDCILQSHHASQSGIE